MKPIANLDVRLAEEIPTLTVELLDNLKQWREAHEAFRSVKKQLVARETRRGMSYLLAEQRAAVHPQMRDAIAFTDYYASQSQTAALALTALRGVREDLKQR